RLHAGAGAARGEIAIRLKGTKAIGVTVFVLPERIDLCGWLGLDAVQGLTGPDRGSGCEPSAAEKCSSRRTGYAVVVDAGAPHARIKAQTRQQAPAEIRPQCPAVALEPPVE